MRILWTAALVAVVVAGPARMGDAAPKAAATGPMIVRFAVVMVNDQEVFRLADSSGMTASERAARLRERLRSVLEPDPGEKWQSVQASDVTVETVDTQPVIRLRNQNVIAVTAQDAQVNRRKLQDLAQRWAEELRVALEEVRLAQGGKLPADFVTVATGRLEFGRPPGGGAGGSRKVEGREGSKEQKDAR